MSVEAAIREKLIQVLQPTRLDVVNESHLHAGHRTSPGTGESHFRVRWFLRHSPANRASIAIAWSTTRSRPS